MTGVGPLVCAVCEQVVGVINVDALAMMLGADECYCCSRCMAQDEAHVDAMLAEKPRDHYAHLVSRALVARELEGAGVRA
jgi:hypothetical protein